MSSYIVVGGKGNMGIRYTSILMSLGHDVYVDDVGMEKDVIPYDKINGVVIATPTDTHYEIIKKYHNLNASWPILCEKPISKNLDDVMELCEMPDLELTMINQYAYAAQFVPVSVKNKMSTWDFVHSGKDGLHWDCINIIGLHEDASIPVLVRRASPNWTCIINGKILSLDDIDRGYYEMIEDWANQSNGSLFDMRQYSDVSYIIKSHKRVKNYEGEND